MLVVLILHDAFTPWTQDGCHKNWKNDVQCLIDRRGHDYDEGSRAVRRAGGAWGGKGGGVGGGMSFFRLLSKNGSAWRRQDLARTTGL